MLKIKHMPKGDWLQWHLFMGPVTSWFGIWKLEH